MRPSQKRFRYVHGHRKARVRKKRMKRALAFIFWGNPRRRTPILQCKEWCNGRRVWAWKLGSEPVPFNSVGKKRRSP